MDFEMINRIALKAQFKNTLVYAIDTKKIVPKEGPGTGNPGWIEGVLEDIWVVGKNPKSRSFLGQLFAPFGGHNYAYGFDQKFMLSSAFRDLNENKAAAEFKAAVLKDMDEKVGQHSHTEDFIEYVAFNGGNKMALLIHAFRLNEVPFKEQVYLVNTWYNAEAEKMKLYNGFTEWSLPSLLVAQFYALGWKRTLTLWALGILVTEGAAAYVKYPFAGWSMITFAIYGQFLNEIYSDPKLRSLKGGLQNLRGLLINGAGGYGAYVTASNLYYDPALIRSAKTGVHHGAHHLGLLLGFVVNRWMR